MVSEVKTVRLRRIAILFGVVAVVSAAAYFWGAKDSGRVDSSTTSSSTTNNSTTVETATLQRSYASGDLTNTASAIRVSETAAPDLLMLAAKCYIQLGMSDEFGAVINEAKEKGVDSGSLQLAVDLFRIQAGDSGELGQQTIQQLEQRGVPKDDARRTVILGCLMRSDSTTAASLVNRWLQQHPDSLDLAYLRAMLAIAQSRWNDAETLLIDSIAKNEFHEMSYLALADLYSKPPGINHQKCRLVLKHCMQRFPENGDIAIQLARVNRELGDNAAASKILESLGSSRIVLFEKADVAFDMGQYAEATELMSKGGLSDVANFVWMIDADFRANFDPEGDFSSVLTQRAAVGATALALGGHSKQAATIFEFLFDRTARYLRIRDLQTKGDLSPNDQTIASKINALVSPAMNPGSPTLAGVSQDNAGDVLAPGNRLYADHCAACHGPTGDGLGISARYLFPGPRNFRDEPIRIVSTVNRIASDQDLARIIRDGLGGVSMPAFAQFSDEQIEQLIAVVRRFQVDGLRDQYERAMLEFDEESDDLVESGADESASDRWIKQRSTSGEPLEIPKFDDPSASAAANGKAVFGRAGCKQCHAASSDDGNHRLKLFDSLGRPLAIRSLVADRFRGGNSREQIYKRVVLGIPGTPHPAIGGLTESDILDIVQYVHELSQESHARKRPLTPATTNFQRRLQSQSDRSETLGAQH